MLQLLSLHIQITPPPPSGPPPPGFPIDSGIIILIVFGVFYGSYSIWHKKYEKEKLENMLPTSKKHVSYLKLSLISKLRSLSCNISSKIRS